MDTPKLLIGMGLATTGMALANFFLPADIPRWLIVVASLMPVTLIMIAFLLKIAYMTLAIKNVQKRSLAAAGFHMESRGEAGGYTIRAIPEAQQKSGFFNRIVFAVDKGRALQSIYVVYSLEHRRLGDIGSLSIVPKHLKKHVHFHQEPKPFAAITYHLMSYWSDFGDTQLADFMYEHQINPHHMFVWHQVPEAERTKALALPPELIMTLYKGERLVSG